MRAKKETNKQTDKVRNKETKSISERKEEWLQKGKSQVKVKNWGNEKERERERESKRMEIQKRKYVTFFKERRIEVRS